MITNIPKVRTDSKSQIKEANNKSKLHRELSYSNFRKPKRNSQKKAENKSIGRVRIT